MQGRHTMRIHVTRKRILGALAAVTLTVVVAATAAALIGGPLHAQRRGFGGPGVRGGTLPLWTVELTDGQQAQVEQIREAAREAAASVRDEMREARQALGEAVRAGVVDESRIRSLAARARVAGSGRPGPTGPRLRRHLADSDAGATGTGAVRCAERRSRAVRERQRRAHSAIVAIANSCGNQTGAAGAP